MLDPHTVSPVLFLCARQKPRETPALNAQLVDSATASVRFAQLYASAHEPKSLGQPHQTIRDSKIISSPDGRANPFSKLGCAAETTAFNLSRLRGPVCLIYCAWETRRVPAPDSSRCARRDENESGYPFPVRRCAGSPSSRRCTRRPWCTARGRADSSSWRSPVARHLSNQKHTVSTANR